MLVYVIPDNKINIDTYGQVLIRKNSRIKKIVWQIERGGKKSEKQLN
jgi:hypothetical protein